MGHLRPSKNLILEAKHKAFPYQCEAVDAIKELPYAAVFHEQGLGKTKIALDVALHWLAKDIVDVVLIVTKKGLVPNWQREVKTHTSIPVCILTQNHRDNYIVFNSPCRVILCHYEVFLSELSRMRLFQKTRNIGIILDESAKIKNPEARVTEVLFDLSPGFVRRIILTGTPVANRPHDIWAQIYFLDGGKSLGRDFALFRSNVDLNPDLAHDELLQETFEQNLFSIFDKISAFSVRETKDRGIIELPDKVVITHTAEWDARQYELYTSYRDELRASVIKDGLPTDDNSESMLKRLVRLVQTASNPALVDENYQGEPGKLPILRDIVSQCIDKGEKVIIWTSFNQNVGWLSNVLSKFGTRQVHGGMNIRDREHHLHGFLNIDSRRVLIATPGAAKEGLTLTVANNVVFYDRVFSLDDYLQAQDRIHRISQKRRCYVHNLLLESSIDEWVDRLLHTKHLAAQLTQGDIDIQEYKQKVGYDFQEMLHAVLNL